jgi:tetratricopeptide (TPR) repeat protein
MQACALRSTVLAAAGLVLWLSGSECWSQQSSDIEPVATPAYSANDEEAQALIELGAVQSELTEFDSAERSYLGGIERLIDAYGEVSPILIDPYRGLARVYLRDGRHAEAVTVLEHAQHITDRNFGLFSTEQSVILNELSQTYEDAGDTRSAQDIQQERLAIGRRRHGQDDLDVIPYHYDLAAYYELSRMRAKAREQYEAVIEIQESHFDRYSAELLKPLRGLIRIDMLSGNSSSARRRLEDILELGTNISALERAQSLAVLGDWDLSYGRLETGLSRYRDAYASLATDDAAAATTLFASPALINFIPPPSPVDRTKGINAYAWGTVSAVFEITADGRARNVEIVSATPPGLMDARYRRRLMESYFRPRIVAGEPATTRQVRFTHDFRYFPAD